MQLNGCFLKKKIGGGGGCHIQLYINEIETQLDLLINFSLQ